MNKTELAGKIKLLEGLTEDEKSALLGLLHEQKKYGLVWEDKPEDVEQKMEDELPILKEVKERAIISDDPSAPNHILIEGDNLHALTALTYTHQGKIDVIYIDPPYNTGNKDFIYNDSFVDKEDGYRHSKWLSFMSKRLKIAKQLLSEKGVIFISIDDNEEAQLKMLCDEIFGEQNKVGVLPTIMNLKGNQGEFGFAGIHEYTLVYALNISSATLNQLYLEDDQIDEWLEDEIGYYKKGATLKRTGNDASRNKRPYGYYPILVHNESLRVTTIDEDEYKAIYDKTTKTFNDNHVDQLTNKYNALGYTTIMPYIDNKPASWRWGYTTLIRDKNDIIVLGNCENFSLYKKQRPELGSIPTKKPKSVLYKPQYSSGNGTSQLKAIFHEKVFDNPKPLDLIFDLLQIGSYKNSIILDFFAGSGTTFHALSLLNKIDKGQRRCILVTNNEESICEKVTYKRVDKIVNGYEDEAGVLIPALHNNTLRYYRTDFVPREQTNKNKRALMAAATDLLCIKNDVYTEQNTFGGRKLKPNAARYFDNGKTQMLLIYNELAVEAFASMLKEMEVEGKIKIYVFSNNRYAYNDNFENVLDKVELCALPAAIYDAYKKVLKPQKVKENVSQESISEEYVFEKTQGEIDFSEEGGEQ